MKHHLQVVPQHQHQAYKMVVHHDQREDFTVYRPAGFVLRWYALTLDLTLSAPLDVLIHLPFKPYLDRMHAYGDDVRYWILAVFLTAVPMLLYFIAPTLIWGQTLGKRIVGVRVLRKSCNPELSLQSVLLRETLGKALSVATVGLGFLMAGIGQRRRALHDYVADTVVISYRQR